MSRPSRVDGLPTLPIPSEIDEALGPIVRTRLPLLILGAPGTGKTTLAREIHQRSSRHGGPFVRADCTTLSRGLVASELWGHERGAFTGADRPRKGLARTANRGTLFFDEIGVLEPPDQARVLSLLESDVVRALGSDREEPLDVRVIAATNAPIEEMTRAGDFRPDLLDRFARPFLRIPPLSERGKEIPLIARRLLHEMAVRRLVPFPEGLPEISLGATRLLQGREWPGSIRQLRVVLAHAVVRSGGRVIRAHHIASSVQAVGPLWGPSALRKSSHRTPQPDTVEFARYRRAPEPDQERARVLRALRSAGSKRGAAKLLGCSRQTVYERIREFNIRDGDWLVTR
jgi:DNA-binding NtrC family response regulator